MKANDWQTCFGAKRRAADRALLAECERAIGLEESAGLQPAKTSQQPSAAVSGLILERDRIARAFGRQIH